MIIHNFNVVNIPPLPAEADSPLIVYSDTVPPFAVALERFETISRRHDHLPQICCSMQD
jgi:hypothetical protein